MTNVIPPHVGPVSDAIRAERYRTIFESMDEGFCLIELLYDAANRPVNYRFLEANSAFERQSGLVGVIGRTILDVVPNFEATWFDTYQQVAVSGQPLRFESEFKSMGIWFDVHASRADAEGRIALLFKDVTASKRASLELEQSTARLEESEANFRSLFDATDEGFCVVDVQFDAHGAACDYLFLQVNPAFGRLTGLEHSQGQSIRTLVPEIEDSWIAQLGAVVRTGVPLRFVNEAAGLGKTFNLYACRIGGAESTRAAVVFTDITESTRADNDLRRTAAELSESDRRKNEFLATLAHELRNPLAPLSNGLHLIHRLRDDPAGTGKVVAMMERQVAQMVHLVNDLLDISRISTGKIELKKTRVDIQTVIRLALESSSHLIVEKNHRLRQFLPAEAIFLECDSTRIAQVVSNLLNNAAKYTRHGGDIDITACVDDDEVVVSVQDNGSGVALPDQSKVFELFAQVEQTSHLGQGGLGIGLSLVRKLVELHDGMVSMTSAGVDKGSTFSIRLPLPKRQRLLGELLGGAVSERLKAGSALRILVVDDNKDAATSLAMLLELDGHIVTTAFDGVEGIARALEFHPEFVFLDIGLPRLNGYEVVRAMRQLEQFALIPIVAITGWGAEHDKEHAQEAGFTSHMTKPAQLDAVLRLIASLRPHPH